MNSWIPQSLQAPKNPQGPKAAENRGALHSALAPPELPLQFQPFLSVPALPGQPQSRPVELPDGAQPADVAAAAGQDGQVMGLQRQEEAFRGELGLRKKRWIPVWKPENSTGE